MRQSSDDEAPGKAYREGSGDADPKEDVGLLAPQRPAGQWPRQDANAAHGKTVRWAMHRLLARTHQEGEDCARLREVVTDFVQDKGDVRGDNHGRRRNSPERDPTPLPSRTTHQQGNQDRSHGQEEHAGCDVGLHGNRRSGGCSQQPGRVSSGPGLPRPEQGQSCAGLDQRRIPDEGREDDHPARGSGKQGRRQSDGSAPDRSRHPPHHRHDHQAAQCDLEQHICRSASAKPRAGEQQIVVEGAVVERIRRRKRAELRDRA